MNKSTQMLIIGIAIGIIAIKAWPMVKGAGA